MHFNSQLVLTFCFFLGSSFAVPLIPSSNSLGANQVQSYSKKEIRGAVTPFSQEVFADRDFTQYTAQLEIGGQKSRLLFDTGSADL